jgi:hypothetical protein
MPWVAAAPRGTFVGHLFYYNSVPWGRQRLDGAQIFTTVQSHPVNPKILWVWLPARKGYRPTLTIRGERLDAPGSFSGSYQGWRDYPSFVDVPEAGCWRITVSTGNLSGRVVFSATD